MPQESQENHPARPFTPSEPRWRPADHPSILDIRLPWSEASKRYHVVMAQRHGTPPASERSPERLDELSEELPDGFDDVVDAELRLATRLQRAVYEVMEPVYADALKQLQAIAPGMTIAPGHPDTLALLRTDPARQVLDRVQRCREEAERLARQQPSRATGGREQGGDARDG